MSKKSFKITDRITRRSESSIDMYLKEVSKIPMFDSPQDEYNCAVLAVKGDAKAKDELIERNLRFVISVAKAYHSDAVMLSDLINEGNLGLIQAAENYDPTRGNKFYSYAVFYIKRNILDYITDYGATIRMPSNKTGLINKLKRHLSIASQKANREVDILDLIISGDKTFTEDELLSVMPYMVNVTSSLDEPIEHHDGTENKHELYEETTFGWADKSISESDTLKSLFKRMDTLRPMERTILNHRYGLNGESEKTLKMCGELEEIGMTAESVRKIEMRALSKLRRGGNLL